ncbi:MAG: thiamine phosphate synthase [Wolbachia sp.]|nr:thiamine phosphate synthase [Wolbachia sp.]
METDSNPEKAREILGPSKIIGLSIESLDELEKINDLDIRVTYVAANAVFATKAKSNIKTLWGVDSLKKVVALSKYPVVAVISAIHESSNPQEELQQLYNIINGA